MLTALIVDDEPRGRTTLRTLLEMHCPDVKILAEADSASAGVEAVREHKPDIVFLDIQMPGGSGFQLLEQVGDIRFKVIFTTAHGEYALKAIKYAALDYLLKPIDGDELVLAVDRARKELAESSGDAAETQVALRGLLENVRAASPANAKIALPFSDGLQFVEVKDIVRFEASGSYTEVVLLNSDKIVVSKPIKVYDDMLGDSDFFRVHNSHLVNLDHVVKYIRSDGGRVEMRDKATIAVSRRKKDELIKRLSELLR